jgi:hypothetical protein
VILKMAAEESNLRPVLLGTGLRDLPQSPVSVPHVPILVGEVPFRKWAHLFERPLGNLHCRGEKNRSALESE